MTIPWQAPACADRTCTYRNAYRKSTACARLFSVVCGVICLGLAFAAPASAEDMDTAVADAAAEAHNLQVVRELCEDIHSNNLTHAKELLRQNPRLTDESLQPWTLDAALNLAIEENRIEMVELLLQNGANPSYQGDLREFGPMHEAVANQNLACVQLLFRYGAWVNGEYDNLREKPRNMRWLYREEIRYGLSSELAPMLYLALSGSSVDIVRALGLRGTCWPTVRYWEPNAWHYAAVSPRAPEMFALIPDAEFDINGIAVNGLTPLKVYCGEDSDLPDVITRKTALPPEVWRKGFDYLIAHGADVHLTEKEDGSRTGWTLLHYIAKVGQPPAVGACVDAGLDINAHANGKETPLDVAIRVGHVVVIPAIIAHGGTCQSHYAIGQTPLSRLLGALYGYGRQPTMAIYTGGERPLVTTAQVCAAIAALIHEGCDPNEVDENGFTPLGLACLSNDLSVVELLLEKGADPNIASTDGLPLYLAATYGRMKFATLLLNHGADPRKPPTLLEDLCGPPANRRLVKFLPELDVDNPGTPGAMIALIYSHRQMPINWGLLGVLCITVLGLGLWIRRWVSVQGAGMQGAQAEAALDAISARADWKAVLAQYETALTFQRKVFLHRPWILIGAFGWVFGIGFLWFDPLLSLLVSSSMWVYVGVFSGGFLGACGLQFARRPGGRILGASLGIVTLIVGAFFAGSLDYVLWAYLRLPLAGSVFALAVLLTLTAAWRFHRTLKAELGLRKVVLPPELQLHRAPTPDGAEIEPAAGWDQGG